MIYFAFESGFVLAQEATDSSSSNPLGFLLPILVIGAVFYVLLVLPQRRRAKKMKQMHQDIGVGDDVRTVGGIFGTVRSDEGDSFVLDVGGGTTMRFAKRAIAEKVEDDEE